MSSYYDDRDDRREHRRREKRDRRDRDRDREQGPVYEEEEIIEARRKPARSDRSDDRGDPRGASRGGELVRRRRDDSSSAEEVERDFPPGGGAYVRRRKEKDRGPPRRARSHGGGKYDYDSYDSYDEVPRKRDRRRGSSAEHSQKDTDMQQVIAVEITRPPVTLAPLHPDESQNAENPWGNKHSQPSV